MPRRKEEGQVVRQEGQQVDEPGKGEDITLQRLSLREAGVQKLGRKQPQNIVHRENSNRHRFQKQQRASVALLHIVKGVEHCDRHIGNQNHGAENIIGAADIVIRGTYLQNFT